MKFRSKLLYSLWLLFLLIGCQSQSQNDTSDSAHQPIPFLPELTPENMIIHSGRLSSDGQEYYYTLSDQSYASFDVWVTKKINNKWGAPSLAAFSSSFSEHGTSFSPDGNTLYFSSTRPTGIEGMAATWHLWQTRKTDSTWSVPSLIRIPNMNDMLISHPSITASGMLYFHASKPDYSEMTLYRSQRQEEGFGTAEKLAITQDALACTPYVTPDGKTLIYAAIGNQLDLMISKKSTDGIWSMPIALGKEINTNGQGNPAIAADGKYLFFTTGTEAEPGQKPDWQVKRVPFSLEPY